MLPLAGPLISPTKFTVGRELVDHLFAEVGDQNVAVGRVDRDRSEVGVFAETAGDRAAVEFADEVPTRQVLVDRPRFYRR